jgi:hypothetical protein
MKEENPKLKKSDLFPDPSLAPRWLAEEFSVMETIIVPDIPIGSFIILPAVTKTNFEKTGSAKFDQRKKYNEVIFFVNPVNVPEEFKLRDEK